MAIMTKKAKEVTGVVTCELLNVRARANSNADIVNVIGKDTVVKVDPGTIGNKFYKVTATRPRTRPLADEVIDGYCMADYISIIGDRDKPDEEVTD